MCVTCSTIMSIESSISMANTHLLSFIWQVWASWPWCVRADRPTVCGARTVVYRQPTHTFWYALLCDQFACYLFRLRYLFRKLFQGPGRHEAAGSCRRSPLLPRAACTTKHTVSLLLLRGSKRAFAGTGMYCMCCSAPTHPLCIAHTTRDIADAYAQ